MGFLEPQTSVKVRYLQPKTKVNLNNIAITLTFLQYFNKIGFQILIKSRWRIKILVLKCLLQFFTKLAVIVRNARIARHQRYLKWIPSSEFSTENSSEEVTLK